MNGLSLNRKIIVKGKLRLDSPLIIGSGQSNLSDIEILKDDSEKPYIPSTSLCGVLRHYFEDNFSDIINKQQSNYFWGIHRPDKKYLFCWEEIPGNDNIRLIEFLIQNFNIKWVKTAKIEKNDDGKTIIVTSEKNVLSLILNDEKTNIDLKINDIIIDNFIVKAEKDKLNIYFMDIEIESALLCHDLYTENSRINIKVRDGIKIDAKNGCAVDAGKFDYEVVEPGIQFNLFWEVPIRQKFDLITFRKIIATLISKLERGELSLGAKTNNGFGKCTLIDTKIFEFDFKQKEDVLQWLRQDFVNGKKKLEEVPYIKDENIFSIEAYFGIKSSFIVRSYPSDPAQPDAVHLSSNEKPILPGTSLKGAIRKRAIKIAKTLCIPYAEDKINELFGTVDMDRKINKKSRILVEETIIDIENVVPELQNRIKIDRFTGGTIKSALFESMPLWNVNNSNSVTVKLMIKDFKGWEVGLLMLILKDLWTEDLPIGGEKNVGRGILSGNMAIIKWNKKELKIEKVDGKLKFSSITDAEELNGFVKQFAEVK